MRIITIIAALLLIGTTAQANELTGNNQGEQINRYPQGQAILFTLNGVDFAVTPYGNMDFELPRYSYHSNYRRSNTSVYNAGYGNVATTRYENRNTRRQVHYDRWGRVKRIKGMRVHYDSHGRVAKIGHIKMKYRRDMLRKIGGMKVKFNRRGRLIYSRGHINTQIALGYGHDCTTHDLGHDNLWDHDHDNNDNNDLFDDGVYYERAQPNSNNNNNNRN